MDSGRLPAYRSSYLLRFHPYPRAKPSTHERIMASAWEDEFYGPPQMNALDLESDISSTFQAIHGATVDMQLRQRRLSISSIIVNLALLFAKTLSLQKH